MCGYALHGNFDAIKQVQWHLQLRTSSLTDLHVQKVYTSLGTPCPNAYTKSFSLTAHAYI